MPQPDYPTEWLQRAPWQTPLAGGRVRCDLCPRYCKLKETQRGFCFVRENRDGRIVSTTYGRSTGFCVDPIEKKPLNHFYPGSPILSFGTAGCNLACRFCQNWESSKAKEVDRRLESASPEAVAKKAKALGVRSIAYTYNDPVIFAEYVIDTTQAARALGVKNVAVTAGYIGESAREEFFRHIDAANVDLKAFTQRFYKELCSGDLEPVKDTLRWLIHESDVWTELTCLLIPGENDSETEIAALAEWVAADLGPDVPLHFTAFHPDYRMIDRPRTPPETLASARNIAQRAGLRYVYTGNVHDESGGSTYCPECNARVIQRDWYVLGEYQIRDGACADCGTKIAGRFEDAPEGWGANRQPVRID